MVSYRHGYNHILQKRVQATVSMRVFDVNFENVRGSEDTRMLPEELRSFLSGAVAVDVVYETFSDVVTQGLQHSSRASGARMHSRQQITDYMSVHIRKGNCASTVCTCVYGWRSLACTQAALMCL